MREWVVRDATGPGHNRRYFVRGTLMFLPFAVALMVLPSPWWVKASLAVMVLLPALYFLSALRAAYLQELLADNDIDPHTQSGRWQVEHDRQAAAYAQKYRAGG
ncbi:putative protein OS=Tsukamurella paurometabola (strain ATCC 8368 / DSM / CCUG 35730 /CIP 100753 / JCM 10117 / KCTC 9821 / NBRC 16120 / NCIMB 702349/ NCTC 13040) OX=521096 GN=Tpau_3471 PE=4 SV=1 [Tsukamurella paurometabola]|uniref:Uncharacterized protein n=2 Tax=Tsukamurella paurometabola TaxID=2061 RepID=D5UX33_TSUPD|nr:conserved hypothetical protein [Tsukamurella paurometabola DSM 20162]SUP38215.1 Uncharacterised protein [Tsukamurella paurometabola]